MKLKYQRELKTNISVNGKMDIWLLDLNDRLLKQGLYSSTYQNGEQNMIEDTRIKQIADHYGIKEQLRQLAEECCELAVEANHSARKGVTVKIIEEIADVAIMMEQIIYLAGIDRKDIDEVIDYKLNRQLERIGKEV